MLLKIYSIKFYFLRVKSWKKLYAVESKLGQRLEGFSKTESTHLLFMGKGIALISKIIVGRQKKNFIVLDGKMVSRFHAEIQKNQK